MKPMYREEAKLYNMDRYNSLVWFPKKQEMYLDIAKDVEILKQDLI